jgi:hypothetical protein
MLDKQTTIDRIEVLPESGHIQIRQKIAIIETEGEGEEAVSKEISYSYHRYVLEKDSDLSGQSAEVVAIAEAAWGC